MSYAEAVRRPPSCSSTNVFYPNERHAQQMEDPGLEITTTVPSIRSKSNTPQTAPRQETAAMLEERLADRVLLYTDDYVTADVQRQPLVSSHPSASTRSAGFLSCPGYTEKRRRLFDTYDHLGLPHVSLDYLRFPQAHRSRLMQAFEALLEFFGDADLIARL
ncbi:hypothetical protein MRX96_048424 [Rhipicephalus microplus]